LKVAVHKTAAELGAAHAAMHAGAQSRLHGGRTHVTEPIHRAPAPPSSHLALFLFRRFAKPDPVTERIDRLEHFPPRLLFNARFSVLIVFALKFGMQRVDARDDGDNMTARQEMILIDKNNNLRFSKTAKEFLIRDGSHREWGARPLRRLIQNEVENKISNKFIKGDFKSNGLITVRAKGSSLVFTQFLKNLKK